MRKETVTQSREHREESPIQGKPKEEQADTTPWSNSQKLNINKNIKATREKQHITKESP